jgi:hypothetical protein
MSNPVVTLAIIGVLLVVATGLLIQPFTKTLWVAVDMLMHRTMGASWGDANVQPGVPPDPPDHGDEPSFNRPTSNRP